MGEYKKRPKKGAVLKTSSSVSLGANAEIFIRIVFVSPCHLSLRVTKDGADTFCNW